MKFFVVSDVHSYYDEMISALEKAGFDKYNPEHWLISCGDSFDRGTQSLEVFNFLDSLKRKILVKGNHDDMLIDLCERGWANMFDSHNGTFGTVNQLSYKFKGVYAKRNTFAENCKIAYEKFKPMYDNMVDYFETKNYIFVHSWIPLATRIYETGKLTNAVDYSVDDWRNATLEEWKEARWGNPFELAEEGYLPDKTIVFGHWHTSWPRAAWEGKEELGREADFSIYMGNGYIGIDAMTSHSGIVNVLVVEDEFMEGK